jgi:hypothetical protein
VIGLSSAFPGVIKISRAAIRDGNQEFLAGKTRPIGEFFADRASGGKRTPRPMFGNVLEGQSGAEH